VEPFSSLPLSGRRNGSCTVNRRARGEKVLDYLGRYVFRIAITNSRRVSLDNGQVRFRYRDNRTQQIGESRFRLTNS
jgi:putative transposase